MARQRISVLILIVFVFGCSLEQSSEHIEDLKAIRKGDSWVYEIFDGVTVSELRAIDGVLTKKVTLKNVSRDQRYYYLPSCYCIYTTQPQSSGKQLLLKNDSIELGLELPLVPKAGQHSIELKPIHNEGSQSHKVVWNFNILEDVSIAPRIIEVSSENSKLCFKAVFRNSNKFLVETISPTIEDGKIADFNSKRIGEPYREAGNCFAQKWEFSGAVTNIELDSFKLLFSSPATNSSFSSNVLIKRNDSKIKFTQSVDFGPVATGKTYSQKIRIGKPYSEHKFTVTDIIVDSTDISVDWKRDRVSGSHWVTVHFSATELGKFEAELDVVVSTDKPFKILAKAFVK